LICRISAIALIMVITSFVFTRAHFIEHLSPSTERTARWVKMLCSWIIFGMICFGFQQVASTFYW
jgi:hypothetical protein